MDKIEAAARAACRVGLKPTDLERFEEFWAGESEQYRAYWREVATAVQAAQGESE